MSDPIRHVNILQSPVFLINSRHPQFCVAPFIEIKEALLFPKLQSQFAEFLQDGYLYALVRYTCSPVLARVRCFLIKFFPAELLDTEQIPTLVFVPKHTLVL